MTHFYAFADRVREAVRNGTLLQYRQFIRDQLAADTCELDTALRNSRNRNRRDTATRNADDKVVEQDTTRKRLRTESGNEVTQSADGVSANS